ncbi:MAG: septal ring lytic transglycosylase RlpA family protein [Micropepsaceae bacterium]
MKLWLTTYAAAIIAFAFLSGCATEPQPKSGTYKVGSPYQIGGVWYYPKEDPFYDETGVASWYGKDFHGKLTANGESYNMNALTAAHRTLPLPSVIRVTNLENGRSIKLRVNDRGPYARGRILDVSRKAADLLGFQGNGTARVRVQYEGRGDNAKLHQDDEGDASQATTSVVRAAPVSSVSASELAPPPGANAAATAAPTPAWPKPADAPSQQASTGNEPDGIVTKLEVPPTTQLWIQVGAFTARNNAERLAATLATVGSPQITKILVSGRPLFRVRFGPFAAVEQADRTLDKVISAGQNGAQIIVE